MELAPSRGWATKKQKNSQSQMMITLAPTNKPADAVNKSAKRVHEFLSDDERFRRFVAAMSDGGVHLVAIVWTRWGNGFAPFFQVADAPNSVLGVTLEEFQHACRHRLCD